LQSTWDSQIKAATYRGTVTVEEGYNDTVRSPGPALAGMTLACLRLALISSAPTPEKLLAAPWTTIRHKRTQKQNRTWGQGWKSTENTGEGVRLLLELLAREKHREEKKKKGGEYWHEENMRHEKLNPWYEGKQRSRELPEC